MEGLMGEQAPGMVRRDFWRLAWDLLVHDITLALLLVGVALTSLLLAVLPQMPAGGPAGDPSAYARWISEVTRTWGRWRGLLEGAGLFAIGRAVWFRLLLAATALSLGLRGVRAIWQLWEGRQPVASPPAGLPRASLEGTPSALARRLRRRRWRLRAAPDDDTHTLYLADRWPWGPLGSLLAHWGPLLWLVGLLLWATGGWEVQEIRLAVGQAAALGGGTDYTVELHALDAASSQAQVILWSRGVAVGQGTVGSGQALWTRGLVVRLTAVRYALEVEGATADGEPLPLRIAASANPEERLFLLFAPDQVDQYFAAPEAEFAAQVTLTDLEAPVPRLRIYRSRTGAPVYDAPLPEDGVVALSNATLHFRPTHYAVLEAVRNPGLPWQGVGLALTGVGVLGMLFWPAWRLWLREGGTEGEEDEARPRTEVVGEPPAALVWLEGWAAGGKATQGWRPRLLGWGLSFLVALVTLGLLGVAAGGMVTQGRFPARPMEWGALAGWLLLVAGGLCRHPLTAFRSKRY